MVSKFSIWLEMMDDVEHAVLGVVSGGVVSSSSEKDHLLMRRTTEFDHSLRDKLRNLGIVKSIGEEDLERYSAITRSIGSGIIVKELIDMIRGMRV